MAERPYPANAVQRQEVRDHLRGQLDFILSLIDRLEVAEARVDEAGRVELAAHSLKGRSDHNGRMARWLLMEQDDDEGCPLCVEAARTTQLEAERNGLRSTLWALVSACDARATQIERAAALRAARRVLGRLDPTTEGE